MQNGNPATSCIMTSCGPDLPSFTFVVGGKDAARRKGEGLLRGAPSPLARRADSVTLLSAAGVEEEEEGRRRKKQMDFLGERERERERMEKENQP